MIQMTQLIIGTTLDVKSNFRFLQDNALSYAFNKRMV